MNQNRQKSWIAVITPPSKGTPPHILNETSQRLLSNMIRQWISDAQLPIQPWSNTLLAIVLSSATHVDTSSHPSHHEARFWIDCTAKGTPEQSQLLTHVYQGEPLSNVLPLPLYPRGHAGGTIKLQGLISSTNISDLVCVLMHVVGNMRLEIDMLRDHHLTQPTQSQKKLPALPPAAAAQKSLIKWVFRNTKKRKPTLLPSLPNTSATTLTKEPLVHNLSNQLSTALISSSVGRRYPLPEVLQHFQDEEKKRHLDRKPPRLPSILSRASSRKHSNNTPVFRYPPALLDRLWLIPPSSLLGFIHQQHIAFAYSCFPRSNPRPCMGPKMARMDYYRYSVDPNVHVSRQFLDQSLGRTVIHISQLSKKTCRAWIRQSRQNDPGKKYIVQEDDGEEEDENNGGCDTFMIDHVFYFAHGMSRIRMDFRDSPKLSDSILMWSSCDQCETTASPRVMSDTTFHYSFAKYLEFLIYDRTSKSSCCHALLSISHWFYFDRCVLRISREAHPPKYTLCTPNLHRPVGPPIDGNSLGREIDAFFTAIIRHLDLIGHYLKGETKHNHQLETQKKELKVLQRAAHADYSDWMLYYSADESSHANDVRRAFVAQATSMLDQINEWQREQCPELIAECAWDPPDYFRSDKKVHAMPESSILVREDEPTSIIAYTLDCADYIAEIQGEDMKPTFIDNSSMLSSTIGEPTTMAEPDGADFYFTSLERYYLQDEASSGIIPPPQPFATARQTLVQRVRQQETHIAKLKTHWRSRFHHSNLPTRWKRYHGHIPIAPTDTIPISWDTQQERTLVQNNNDVVKEIKLSTAVATVVKRADPKSPHIRHKFVHGNTEFTCIVYYAHDFDALRKRCGMNSWVIESLCRCQSWKATGGKSKSRFYKTQDDRLVIKEMISSWNLAEKQHFLEFAPAYFEYMKKAYEGPSVLTKIFGFYTIRMTDNHRRITWAMDVMVMDHLFHNRSITQRFDFKGIRDRQAENQQAMTTLWDSDWIHGYRLALPTTHHSKALLIDTALQSDTEFIEKCNIMDYSLLVGIDETNKEIIVGIVDFIGAYTWYKKIESKSKSTLKPQKQVTVLPPQQYRARFCREISNYFCSVPGKFDRVEPKEERNSFVASFCGFHMSS
ncbi:hypothetical protein BJV82DRAFT_618896 [Fennellomyces sp. T-0311]|nr:hypothetical protein BJV82DRAFT_618896 [Fennellomyces sp. T-0311]